MEATDLIFKALEASSAPLKAGELTEITGLDRKAVEKAMKKLKARTNE